MSRVWKLRVWTRFHCEPAAVWAHKIDPDMLAREFKPYVHMTMSASDQDAVRRLLQGTTGSVQVRAQLGPAGLKWPMEVSLIEPGRRYQDVSSNALFKSWTHDHQILTASDGCLYVDEVRFVSALPFCKPTALAMERLMKHRHRVSAEYLPAEAGSIGVSALRLDCPSGSG